MLFGFLVYPAIMTPELVTFINLFKDCAASCEALSCNFRVISWIVLTNAEE